MKAPTRARFRPAPRRVPRASSGARAGDPRVVKTSSVQREAVPKPHRPAAQVVSVDTPANDASCGAAGSDMVEGLGEQPVGRARCSRQGLVLCDVAQSEEGEELRWHACVRSQLRPWLVVRAPRRIPSSTMPKKWWPIVWARLEALTFTTSRWISAAACFPDPPEHRKASHEVGVGSFQGTQNSQARDGQRWLEARFPLASSCAKSPSLLRGERVGLVRVGGSPSPRGACDVDHRRDEGSSCEILPAPLLVSSAPRCRRPS